MLNELLEFNFDTLEWTDLTLQCRVPIPGRANPGLAAADGKLYLFGGLDEAYGK